MPEPHEGQVEVPVSFEDSWTRLDQAGPLALKTSRPTRFRARASTARDGRQVIIFMAESGQETARAYACCWGRYHNCNRTRIGMYVKALMDAWSRW